MATRARVTVPLLFLLGTSLLFAAAVSASHGDEEDRRGGHSLQQCVKRCQEDRPRYSHARCVQECRDDQQQHGRHEQEERSHGRGRQGEGEREEEHGCGRGRHGEGEREEEQGRGRGRRGEGEREEHGRHGQEEQGRGWRGEGEREQEQGDSRRPYVFGPRSFRSIIRSDHGFVKALRPFDEVSRLLRGIRNYRVAIMEVNPRSFVVPGLTDADGVGYVAQGEGVLTVIENGEKRSYTVRQGDVIVAPAGSIMHLANTDGRRKLVIAKILHTISVPGKFQYFSAKPLLASLSKRVLRAALKTSDERLERLFNPRQGEEKTGSMSIVRASEEQLGELRRQASEGGQGHRWPLPPFRGDSRDTFNLLEQRPKIANRHGRLFEADARSFHALANHDVRVAVANITPLLFAAAVSASHDEDEARRGGHSLQQCVQRCQEDRPRYSHARCLQECRDDQQQHGRHEQEERSHGRGRHGEGEREEEHGRGRGGHGEGEREEEQGRGRGRRGEGEREEHGRREQEEHDRGWRGEGEREEEQGDSRRPYVFGPRSFRSIIRSDHGFVKALRPFDEVSRLLRGIRNYRVAIMEVNPRSFVVPGLTDADGVGYVAQGEGVLTVIENGEKRSYTVRQGDVIVAPAGSIMHLANTDGRRKLVIAKILHAISVPGKFQFLSAKPLLASLSKRVLRAALKTSDERLERLFGRRQGEEEEESISIVRASEEQLRELRRQASEGGQGHQWPLPPFRGDSRNTYNLLEQRPKIANRHGRLYEADARSFHALAHHDVRVAVANITPGSMTAPYLNTQSFKLAVVLEGQGEVQIVCPHLGRDSEREQEQGKGRWREQEDDDQRQQRRRGSGSESESEEEEHQDQQRYETVRARVSRGSAFVVPPGHPVVEIASSQGSSNLQVVCFEINAERNERVWLAGRNNVIGKLDSPAQELTFGRPAREVQEVFRAKDQDEGFVAGPEQQSREQEQEQERHRRRGDRGRGRGDDAVETFLRMATGAL